MAESQISGAYVTAFVASSGAVSPVFEEKPKQTLADNGITDPTESDWYDNEQFGDALSEIVDKAGEKTVIQAGREMVKITDDIVEQESIEAGLEVFTSQHDAIHRNHSRETAGVVEYERLGENHYRVAAAGEGYEYPVSLTKGAATETVRQTGGPIRLDVEDIEPQGDEVFAFEISW
jgi:hypothetical protein